MSCEVTWQIKYIMAPLVEETGHKLGRVLTYRNMLPPLKPHDLWIKRSTCGHMTVWKMYISAFKKCIYPLSRLKATKLRRDLRYIRMFSTQTLKSSLIVINFEQVGLKSFHLLENYQSINCVIEDFLSYRCLSWRLPKILITASFQKYLWLK